MSDGNGSLTEMGGGKRPIRLLEIIGNAIVGGMETYTRNLIAGLDPDRYEVVCLLPYESAYTATLRDLGCKVYITPIHDDPLWRSIEMAVEVVKMHGIDLIHANLANAQTLAGVVGRMTNTPAAATLHSRTLWIQEVSVTRIANMHLITVCQEAFSQALAVGVPLDRLSLIPNGVDVSRFTPARSGAPFRASLGLDDATQLVGFVGRLSWEKGPDKFVHAAQRINAQMPDVHFVMVGEGHAETDIRQLIEHLGMEERIHLVGSRRDVEASYPAFDLQIQTSRSEAMPLALLEGMACGVPTVALSVGGVPEIVASGQTGMLVNPGDWPGVANHHPGDWEGIACASLDLLRDPARLKRMGAAARARAEDLFDLRRSVRETSALFERLVKPAVMKNGAWQSLPTVMRDKGDGDRRVRLKSASNLDGAAARPGLAAVRSVES